MHGVRIYEMPSCRMVSSGVGMFGEEKFERFNKWFSSQKQTMFPRDYLFWAGSGFEWLYLYEEGMAVPEEFEIIDFPGGIYAVATDIDGKTDVGAMNAEVDAFLEANGLERDSSRKELGNIISTPAIREIIGYDQMDYYAPVKKKN